jgi:hypothetical protein
VKKRERQKEGRVREERARKKLKEWEKREIKKVIMVVKEERKGRKGAVDSKKWREKEREVLALERKRKRIAWWRKESE